jgi:hypothetical protein
MAFIFEQQDINLLQKMHNSTVKKIEFTPEQAMKAQRWDKCITLIFL